MNGNKGHVLLSALRLVVDAVLPARCPSCGTIVDDAHQLCVTCWTALDFLSAPGCGGCNTPLDPTADDETLCARCLQTLPAHGPVFAVVRYGEVARSVVLKLKYGRRPALGRTIGRLLRPLPDIRSDAVVIPVPLHWSRMWSRGYNQAAEIARAFAGERRLELDLTTLRRVKRTASLRGAGAAQRRKLLQGAFATRGKLDGRPVYLVDDVYTSGATANACGRVLQRAGAGPIATLCWARVVQGD